MKISIHILPERWPDLTEKYAYAGFIHLGHHKPCCARMMMGDNFFREIDDRCWSPRRRIEDCDRDGRSEARTLRRLRVYSIRKV